MVLLRLRDEEGFVGLGEAVPLTLRAGAGLAQVVAELEGLSDRDSLDEQALAGDTVALSAPARCAALTALADLRGRRAEEEHGTVPGPPPPPVRCNATLSAGEPGEVAAEALALGRGGLLLVQAEARGGRRPRPGAGGPRSGRARRPDQGRRQRRLGRRDGEADARATSRSSTSSSPSSPSPAPRRRSRSPASTSIPIAADESVASRAEAERAVAMGAWSLTGVKLSKVGGPEAAIEIAEVIPTYVTSALDGPVGIAAARRSPALARGGGERARPRARARHPAPVRGDHRRGRLRAARTGCSTPRRARASGSRSTRPRSRHTGSRTA